MNFTFGITATSLGLLVGILIMIEVGRQLGMRRRARTGKEASGLGPLEGAVFTLLGLLVAFTFHGAAERFDTRRQLVAQEANDVGTAWLRIQLMPEEERAPLQQLFRNYLDARLLCTQDDGDSPAAQEARGRASTLQQSIWTKATAACQKAQPFAAMLLVPAINAMFDISTTRQVATWSHPPLIIYALLFALALFSALLSGYETAGNVDRSWLHSFFFALAVALAVAVILDIEHPRHGIIRVDRVDQVLVDLRRSFGQ